MKLIHGSNALTKKEARIVGYVADGLTNRKVAEEIGSTEHVIKNHMRIIYDKLGFSNRVELALWHVAREQESISVVGDPEIIKGEQ